MIVLFLQSEEVGIVLTSLQMFQHSITAKSIDETNELDAEVAEAYVGVVKEKIQVVVEKLRQSVKIAAETSLEERLESKPLPPKKNINGPKKQGGLDS